MKFNRNWKDIHAKIYQILQTILECNVFFIIVWKIPKIILIIIYKP